MITIVIPYEQKVIWQSDAAKSYCCLQCDSWLRTQYEGGGAAYCHKMRWSIRHSCH